MKTACILFVFTFMAFCLCDDSVPDAPEVTEDVVVVADKAAQPIGITIGTSRVEAQTRRRYRNRRRGRSDGFFNDGRYRYTFNNPNNPMSPYAYRRPPIQAQNYYQDPRAMYDYNMYDPYVADYYDPRYGYHYVGQAQYYNNYNYARPEDIPLRKPAVHPRQVPTATTETLPELYYVQKVDKPGSAYEYKKLKVVQDESGNIYYVKPEDLNKTTRRVSNLERRRAYYQQSAAAARQQQYYAYPMHAYARRMPYAARQMQRYYPAYPSPYIAPRGRFGYPRMQPQRPYPSSRPQAPHTTLSKVTLTPSLSEPPASPDTSDTQPPTEP